MLLVTAVLTCFATQCIFSVLADGAVGHLTSPDGEQLVDFDRLSRLLETLDFHLQDFQQRTCLLGLHSHNCAFVDMDKLKNTANYLRSGENLGKRDSELVYDIPGHKMTSDEFRAANAVLEDLVEQRRAISILKRLLVAMKNDLDKIRTEKRDCRFRLGGHCLTESLDRVASQFYYLKSPNSPGRRRRHLENADIRRFQHRQVVIGGTKTTGGRRE